MIWHLSPLKLHAHTALQKWASIWPVFSCRKRLFWLQTRGQSGSKYIYIYIPKSIEVRRSLMKHVNVVYFYDLGIIMRQSVPFWKSFDAGKFPHPASSVMEIRCKADTGRLRPGSRRWTNWEWVKQWNFKFEWCMIVVCVPLLRCSFCRGAVEKNQWQRREWKGRYGTSVRWLKSTNCQAHSEVCIRCPFHGNLVHSCLLPSLIAI